MAARYASAGMSSDGLPLGPDDVLVGDGTTREVVLSRATLDCDGFSQTRLLRRFRNGSAEADFVLFTNRTRIPLFIVTIYELLLVPVPQAMGSARPVIVTYYGIITAILILAVLLTDSVAAFVVNRCPALCLSRKARASIHELLFCVILIIAGPKIALNGAVDPSNRFACREPWSYAVKTPGSLLEAHGCDVISMGTQLKFLTYATIFAPRVAAIVVTAPVMIVLLATIATVNFIGPAARDFYNVSGAELASRVLLVFFECAVALLICAVRERRRRDHFVTAVGLAVASQGMAQTNRRLFALQQLMHAVPASSTGLLDRAAANNPLAHGRVTATGEAAALWADFVAMPLSDPPQGPSETLRASQMDDFAAAINRVLGLAGRHPRTRAIGVLGDSIWAVGALRVGASTAELADDVRALCWQAHFLVDAVRRIAATTPLWRDRVALRTAVTCGAANEPHGASGAPELADTVDANSQVVCDARWVCNMPSIMPWSTIAAGEAIDSVAPDFEVVSRNRVQTAPIAVIKPIAGPAACRADPEAFPATLADALEDVPLDHKPDGEQMLATEEHALDLTLISWCPCARGSAVLRTFFPRFAGDTVENDYVDHDDDRVRSGYVAHGVVALLTVLVIVVLLTISEALTPSVGVVCFVSLLAFLAATVLTPRMCPRVTTPKRAFLLCFYSALAMSCLVVAVVFAYGSQAQRHVVAIGAPLATCAAVIAPESRFLRIPMIVLTSAMHLVIVTVWPPPGQEFYMKFASFGLVMNVVIAILVSRSTRAQYADLRFLETLRARAVRASIDADTALLKKMPPFVSIAVRNDVDEPLSRCFTVPTALVLHVEVDAAAMVGLVVASARHLANGALLQPGDPAMGRQRAHLVHRLLEAVTLPVLDNVSSRRLAAQTARRYSTAAGDSYILAEFGEEKSVKVDGSAWGMIRAARRLDAVLSAVAEACLLAQESPETPPHQQQLPAAPVPPAALDDSGVSAPLVLHAPDGAGLTSLLGDLLSADATTTTTTSMAPPRQVRSPVRAAVHQGALGGWLAEAYPAAFVLCGPAAGGAKQLARQPECAGMVAVSTSIGGLSIQGAELLRALGGTLSASLVPLRQTVGALPGEDPFCDAQRNVEVEPIASL